MSAPSGRNRHRRPGRRQPFRDPRPRMLIVCEGRNTEPQYFEQFAGFHRNSLVRIEIAPEHGVPLTVVRAAKRRKDEAASTSKREKDENIKFDSVWCVFDIDEHPHVAEAKSMAHQNGIRVAMSNPCFELWLLLHLRDCPGMLHRHAAQSMLKTHVADYDKKVAFEVYRDGYDRAVQRARHLDRLAEAIGEPGRNPTTNVYELTETIIPQDDGASATGPAPADPVA